MVQIMSVTLGSIAEKDDDVNDDEGVNKNDDDESDDYKFNDDDDKEDGRGCHFIDDSDNDDDND